MGGPHLVAPITLIPVLLNHISREKNRGERIIMFHKTEPPPLIPAGSILTPHPGEFERLVGKWSDDFEKLELLKSWR
jgi:hypothetical protein